MSDNTTVGSQVESTTPTKKGRVVLFLGIPAASFALLAVGVAVFLGVIAWMAHFSKKVTDDSFSSVIGIQNSQISSTPGPLGKSALTLTGLNDRQCVSVILAFAGSGNTGTHVFNINGKQDVMDRTMPLGTIEAACGDGPVTMRFVHTDL
jgi:hypothetical protein